MRNTIRLAMCLSILGMSAISTRFGDACDHNWFLEDQRASELQIYRGLLQSERLGYTVVPLGKSGRHLA